MVKSKVFLIVAAILTTVTWIFSRSFLLALAVSVVAIALPIEWKRFRHAKLVMRERESWPMVIDHLISGVNSGVSLQQSVYDLAARGPENFRSRFAEIASAIRDGESFPSVLMSARRQFNTYGVDQVFGVLVVARVTGSSDVGSILRTLGDFLRQENALRSEIEARHGWVRSSASLAAIAPWLLLLILASQPSTRAAFSSETGIYILGLGLVLTAIAFIWMNIAGRLPEVPRALS